MLRSGAAEARGGPRLPVTGCHLGGTALRCPSPGSCSQGSPGRSATAGAAPGAPGKGWHRDGDNCPPASPESERVGDLCHGPPQGQARTATVPDRDHPCWCVTAFHECPLSWLSQGCPCSRHPLMVVGPGRDAGALPVPRPHDVAVAFPVPADGLELSCCCRRAPSLGWVVGGGMVVPYRGGGTTCTRDIRLERQKGHCRESPCPGLDTGETNANTPQHLLHGRAPRPGWQSPARGARRLRGESPLPSLGVPLQARGAPLLHKPPFSPPSHPTPPGLILPRKSGEAKGWGGSCADKEQPPALPISLLPFPR